VLLQPQQLSPATANQNRNPSLVVICSTHRTHRHPPSNTRLTVNPTTDRTSLSSSPILLVCSVVVDSGWSWKIIWLLHLKSLGGYIEIGRHDWYSTSLSALSARIPNRYGTSTNLRFGRLSILLASKTTGILLPKLLPGFYLDTSKSPLVFYFVPRWPSSTTWCLKALLRL